MSLKKNIYSVLIVSATDSFTTSFLTLLPQSRYSPVNTATSISMAKRLLTEKSYDFIIINSPLPDDDGTRFAIDISTNKQSVVLIIVKNDIWADIQDKVAEYGVFTLPKPISKTAVTYALNWLESARERLRIFENKSLSIEDKMAQIRLVNKAKWLLISKLGMDESEAHHYIEKQAMDNCISKKSVAEDIIKKYS